jgi:hypothetical protein
MPLLGVLGDGDHASGLAPPTLVVLELELCGCSQRCLRSESCWSAPIVEHYLLHICEQTTRDRADAKTYNLALSHDNKTPRPPCWLGRRLHPQSASLALPIVTG